MVGVCSHPQTLHKSDRILMHFGYNMARPSGERTADMAPVEENYELLFSSQKGAVWHARNLNHGSDGNFANEAQKTSSAMHSRFYPAPNQSQEFDQIAVLANGRRGKEALLVGIEQTMSLLWLFAEAMAAELLKRFPYLEDERICGVMVDALEHLGFWSTEF